MQGAASGRWTGEVARPAAADLLSLQMLAGRSNICNVSNSRINWEVMSASETTLKRGQSSIKISTEVDSFGQTHRKFLPLKE